MLVRRVGAISLLVAVPLAASVGCVSLKPEKHSGDDVIEMLDDADKKLPATVMPDEVVNQLASLSATVASQAQAIEALRATVDEQADMIDAQNLTISGQTSTIAGQASTIAGQTSAIAALQDTNCPSGYTRDTSAANFVLCKKGADEMVKVGDFWVDRYEAVVASASVYNGGKCDGECKDFVSCPLAEVACTCFGGTTPPAKLTTGMNGGVSPTDNYPLLSFPDNGNISLENGTPPVFACSVAGLVGSRKITWFQAAQACVASGKHLISNDEWQTAAAGTLDLGERDGADGSCNTKSTGPRANGLGTGCRSIYGAEDMNGNLWEWTSLWGQAGPTHTASTGVMTHPWPWSDDKTNNINGAAYNGSVWINGLPAAAVRGGDWGEGTNAGVFAFSMNDSPSSFAHWLGFRCARTNR